jgi:hypothetical protein
LLPLLLDAVPLLWQCQRPRHVKRMTVKALPGSALEVIETKFFFQLLVSLLANPSRLDGGR